MTYFQNIMNFTNSNENHYIKTIDLNTHIHTHTQKKDPIIYRNSSRWLGQ